VLLTRKTLERLTEIAKTQSGEIVTPAVEAAKPEKREEAKQ
jgi:hypothetical protein